jgi:hypothetical protein
VSVAAVVIDSPQGSAESMRAARPMHQINVVVSLADHATAALIPHG